MIDAATRAQVIARAANRCEYCQIHQHHYEATFHIEHITAQQHATDDRLPVVTGITLTGRATIAVLDLNNGDRIRLRQLLIAEGVFPPA